MNSSRLFFRNLSIQSNLSRQQQSKPALKLNPIHPKSNFKKSNQNLNSILKSKLEKFNSIELPTIYSFTLNLIGLLKPKNHHNLQSHSWLNQLKSLILNYSDDILNNNNKDLNYLNAEFKNLFKSNSTNPISTAQNFDRTLLAHFIPWASTQTHRLHSSQNQNSSVNLHLKNLLAFISKLIDMRHPQNLYPDTRRYKRQIHLHVGPTNSGKTHNALRALLKAHSGIYAGPLRLLAHEIFTRINSGQIAPDLPPRHCNLLTGEEQRIISPFATLTSCTVEMLSSHQFYDVVVIDEIQMIGDIYRGDAWTQALLGVQTKQLHLCGEESVIDLIRNLSNDCGDEFILHRYQRLTPLKISDSSLAGNLSNVKQGDCIITFSRNNIYSLKKLIQSKTNLRVGLAYGGLPPEVREREAQMFNRGNQLEGQAGYDVLVGSDAIGMGLNLKINRVIFESLHKFDGLKQIQLSPSQIKQIGGRAGRYGILPSNLNSSSSGQNSSNSPSSSNTIGEVLTLLESDMDLLRQSMAAPSEPISKAVLKAPFETIQGLARLVHHGTPFSTLLTLRRNLTATMPQFEIGDEKSATSIADAIENIKTLSLSERDLFCSAPANPRNPLAISSLQAWANAHGSRKEVNLEAWLRHQNLQATIQTIQDLPNQIQNQPPSQPIKHQIKLERLHNETLLRLESLHKCLVLYLWLSFRLPESFPSSRLCESWKLQCEDALAVGLNAVMNVKKTDQS
ncbi:hypothetical protein O181_033191 [Austropuccinia psidii MF-1]|uniref:RNA helicase n=1 Tax=Austropuccinia psidii MF-1 TaxID=1389203 RepID=A0A9Q3D3X9_9BASI|nr:hypothetical protein [Austropuccinia psidii MF-1]